MRASRIHSSPCGRDDVSVPTGETDRYLPCTRCSSKVLGRISSKDGARGHAHHSLSTHVHNAPAHLLALEEDLNHAFFVEIGSDKIVADLKKAIKEAKKPTVDHLPDNALDLWKVSIPADNGLRENTENLDFTHGFLLPLTKLSILFTEAPAEGQTRIHIVVKFPVGEPDNSPRRKRCVSIFCIDIMYVCSMTHAPAHHKVIKDTHAAAAPSSGSNSAALFRSQQEQYLVYNGRPANRRGPPLAIYHTAFAQLKDALQDLNNVVDPRR